MTNTENEEISYDTLADLRRDQFQTLWGTCQRCFRSEKLDLERLIDVLGEDFPNLQLHWKLRCVVCDKDQPPIRLRPNIDKPLCRSFFSSCCMERNQEISDQEIKNRRAGQLD